MKNTKSTPPDSSLNSMKGALGHGCGPMLQDIQEELDKRYTLPMDYAMGLTVSTDYRQTNRRIPLLEDPAATNKQSNFDEGLVLRQPL